MILQDFYILKSSSFQYVKERFPKLLPCLDSIKIGWDVGIVNTPGIEPDPYDHRIQ
jgi:hypothetical protein